MKRVREEGWGHSGLPREGKKLPQVAQPVCSYGVYFRNMFFLFGINYVTTDV